MAENSIPEKASFSNESIKSVLFSTIFIFQSNLGNIRRFFEQKLKFIFFPLAALTEVITTFLALWRLIKTDNKNLGKTFDFVLSFLTTSLVLTAVIGGLALWLNPIMVSSLFIGAIGLGVIYLIGQFFHHAYRWLSTPSIDKEKRAFFREKTLKYLQGSLVGLAVIAGIVITMLLPMAAPIVLAVGISVAVVLFIDRIYKICQYCSATHSTENKEDNNYSLDETSIENQSSIYHYYGINNRTAKLTGNLETDKIYLVKEIKEKINSLRQEIKDAERTWMEFFFPQKDKRINKIIFLSTLGGIAQSYTDEKEAAKDRFEYFKKQYTDNPRNTFQSPRRETSDVKDMFNATISFFTPAEEKTDGQSKEKTPLPTKS
ncbi:MAG: hypothetical protein V4700_04210 [Pseudomonadota bacterium]